MKSSLYFVHPQSLRLRSMHGSLKGFSGGSVVKNPSASAEDIKRHRFDPWVGKILWRRAWKPTTVFLPGEPHGLRSLEGYRTWGHNESDTSDVTEHSHMHAPCY